MAFSKNLKMFMSYVLPSMISMLIIGSYSIIDTIFIGQSAGEVGLAAVAITWPIVMLFGAFGDMLGTGAAIIISQSRGRSDIARARMAFGNMIVLQVIFSFALMIILGGFLSKMLLFLGASSEFIQVSVEYAHVMISFNIVSMFIMGISSVIRNDARPVLAMWLTIFGLLLNIGLDYLFVFPLGFGVVGAAYATIISQAICTLIGLGYFATRYTVLRYGMDMFRIRWAAIAEIIKNGIPSLGNQLSIIVMLLLHNYQSMRYGGINGLAAYTFVGAMESIGSLLMTGLSLGVLPLAAYLYGAKHYSRQNIVGNMGYKTAFVLGVLMMTISIAGHNIFPAWFNLSGGAASMASHALIISSTAFILLGVVRVAGYYYQATGKIRAASMLIYGDSFFALPLCLFILPMIFGLDGVWLAMPVSRVLLFGLVCWLWFGHGKSRTRALETNHRIYSIRKYKCN